MLRLGSCFGAFPLASEEPRFCWSNLHSSRTTGTEENLGPLDGHPPLFRLKSVKWVECWISILSCYDMGFSSSSWCSTVAKSGRFQACQGGPAACFKACSYNKCRANTAEKTQYLHHTKFGAVSIFPCDCKLTSLQVKAFWVLADSSSIPALCWCCGTQPMSEGMLRCTSKKRTTMKPDDNPRFSVLRPWCLSLAVDACQSRTWTAARAWLNLGSTQIQLFQAPEQPT